MKALLSLLFSLLAVTPVFAATITAASTSRTDVGAAISIAVTGDTVLVPAGLSVWTNSLVISGKGITFRGTGTNATIIVDENPTARVNQPTLLDVTWQGTNGGMFDLSGFQFRGGTTQTATAIMGLVRVKASNNMTNDSVWRIHNCWFNDPWGRPMQIRAWSGLIDSNTFSLTHHLAGIAFDGRIATGEYGDRSWNVAPPAGTTNLLYFEHNLVSATGTPRAILDSFAGVRYVARFNSITNRCVENHGTESTQRARSGRYMEIYGNTFTQTGGSGEYCSLFRGGSGLVMSNIVVGGWPGLMKGVYFLSAEGHSPWGQANGTNVWDVNIAGGPFETGTHTGTNGSADLIDGTKTWTIDQWQKYSVINYSQTYTNAGAIQHFAGLISGNTATTLTTVIPNPVIEQFTWNTGDSYKVWRVDIGLDAPGRGSGDLLSGGSSTLQPTPTVFPNESDEPIHLWANTGTTAAVATGLYPIIEGRDWTNAVLSGYTPLVNPHPLAGGTNVLPPPPPPPPPLPASMLAFSQQPTSHVQNGAISPPVTVRVLDANGNLVTTSSANVTMVIGINPGGGTLSGTLTVAAASGIATFGNLSINNPGMGYTLVVSSSGLGGATSTSFDISSSIGPSAKLVMAQQPVDTQVATLIAPSVTVKITDASGTQTAATANITVAFGSNPGGGVLSGTLTRGAVSGLATFDDLQISTSAAGYTLSFTSAGLTGVTSTSFNVTTPPPPTPGPATQLVFFQQPTTTASGVFIAPAVRVHVLDAVGALTDSITNVTIAISSNPAGGTLSGTLTMAAFAGVATFNNLSINNSGNGYTLAASAIGLTSATSSSFNITGVAGIPNKLLVAQQPSNTSVNIAISPAITVKIADALSAQTTSSANVTVVIKTNPGGGTLSGTLTQTAVNGLATFTDLQINKAGNGYTLRFSSSGLTSATTVGFNIVKTVGPPKPPKSPRHQASKSVMIE